MKCNECEFNKKSKTDGFGVCGLLKYKPEGFPLHTGKDDGCSWGREKTKKEKENENGSD